MVVVVVVVVVVVDVVVPIVDEVPIDVEEARPSVGGCCAAASVGAGRSLSAASWDASVHATPAKRNTAVVMPVRAARRTMLLQAASWPYTTRLSS